MIPKCYLNEVALGNLIVHEIGNSEVIFHGISILYALLIENSISRTFPDRVCGNVRKITIIQGLSTYPIVNPLVSTYPFIIQISMDNCNSLLHNFMLTGSSLVIICCKQ